jgi:hypothetical protein
LDYPEVKNRVEAALAVFEEEDYHLLEHDLSERCISARVAMYLQELFPDYSVDVEYNRAGETPKRLNLPEHCANYVDEQGRALVVPDVIIHRRGAEGPNLLAIEVKKTSNPDGSACDRERIQALRTQLQYQ